MKVLVIGANGKIGRILCQKMKQKEQFEPIAFIRNQEQVDFFDKLMVPTIISSLEYSVDELKSCFNGIDAIVFTAGSGAKTGADKTLEIDLDGAVKSIIAAEKANVNRYVMVSVARADDRSWWDTSKIKPYFIAKHFADNALKASKLDYTIVRPVRLTDDKGEGSVTMLATNQGLLNAISREDVADVVIKTLLNSNSIKKILEISSGEIPIDEAILNL